MKSKRNTTKGSSVFRLLPYGLRCQVRRIARESFNEEVARHSDPKSVAGDIKKDSLLSFSRKYKESKEFKSIFSILITAVVVKLATALIEDWIDKHLFNSVGLIYQEDEPGFLEPTANKK